VFLFRPTAAEQRPLVCCGITASVYDKVLHYCFGVNPVCAAPDQIDAWVEAPVGEWVQAFCRDPDLAAPRGRGEPPVQPAGSPGLA
jgi:hypothetical protein